MPTPNECPGRPRNTLRKNPEPFHCVLELNRHVKEFGYSIHRSVMKPILIHVQRRHISLQRNTKYGLRAMRHSGVMKPFSVTCNYGENV